MKDSATSKILAHMKRGKPISGWFALMHFGVYRLSDVVFKLRRRGHKIKTRMVRQGKKEFASYSL